MKTPRQVPLLLLLMMIFVSCKQQESTTVKEIHYPSQQSSNSQTDDSNSHDQGQTPGSRDTTLDESKPLFFTKVVSNQAMATHRKTLDKRDPYFIEYNFHHNENKNLNGLVHSEGTRTFIIRGKSLELSNERNKDLINLLNNANDIEILRIEADELTLSEKIILPQTRIEIFAREFRITKNGQFNTTPKDYGTRATFNEEEDKGNDGLQGLPAGDVILNVGQLTIDERDSVAFILRGGKGQKAGPGKNGLNGSSVHDYGGGRINNCSSRTIRECAKIERPDRDHCYYVKVWSCDGNANWPGDGQRGSTPGLPGAPGNGGNLISNYPIAESLADLSMGEVGEKSEDAKGGSGGNPRTAHFYQANRHASNIEVASSRTSRDGETMSAPELLKHESKNGQVIVHLDKKEDWASEGMVHYTLKYANELFLNNAFDQARVEFTLALNAVSQLKSEELEEKRYIFEKSINQQLVKMNANLDYFGNELTWAPRLNFGANLELFQQELTLAAKIYYLSQWILKSSANLESKQAALEKAQELLFEEIKSMQKEHDEINTMLPVIEVEKANIEIEEKFVNEEIQRVIRIIEENARRNVYNREKKAKFLKILKTAAAIASVVPIGQPAFAAAGTALNVIANKVDLDDPLSIARTVYSGYSTFKKEGNLRTSSEHWNKHWRSVLEVRNWTNLSNDQRKEKLKELYSYAKPVVSTISDEMANWNNYKQPSNAVEAEIAKMKAEDPLFQELSKKITNLVKKRESLHNKIQSYVFRRAEIETKTFDNISAISDLQDPKSRYAKIDNNFVVETIRQMKSRAQERLLKYHYRLARAYEYRTLKQYSLGLNLDAVWTKIEDLVTLDS
ncbi:MAG: hypothetical protein Fur0010_25540 [Bdellovibrio sp.]